MNGLKSSILKIAFGEMIVWAGMFYLFPALLLSWEESMHWTRVELTLASTLCILVSAISSPLAGKIIDKGYGRHLLTGSALLAALLLLALSFATNLFQFYAVWILIGFCMAGCFFIPCISFLTHCLGRGAKTPITVTTLVGGMASAISFPTASALVAVSDWRLAVTFFAVAIGCVAAPFFWFGGKGLERRHNETLLSEKETENDQQNVKQKKTLRAKDILKQPIFWLLAIPFALLALGHGMVINHLLPLLQERNVSADAAILAVSMLGPMHVTGRLVMMAGEKALSNLLMTTYCFGGLCVSSLCLIAAGVTPSLLVLFVVLQGACFGMTTVLKALVTVDLMGSSGFGVISGLMAVPYLGGLAIAPFMGAFLWRLAGYDMMIYLISFLAFTSFLMYRYAVVRHHRKEQT